MHAELYNEHFTCNQASIQQIMSVKLADTYHQKDCAYLSMVYEDLEERVHQKDSVWQNAAAVQEHWLHTRKII